MKLLLSAHALRTWGPRIEAALPAGGVTFITSEDALPHESCAMLPDFRRTYESWAPEIAAAVAPSLVAHRDFIYGRHLVLPVQV